MLHVLNYSIRLRLLGIDKGTAAVRVSEIALLLVDLLEQSDKVGIIPGILS